MASELIPRPPFPMQCSIAIGIFVILTIGLFILNHVLKKKDPKDPKKKKSNGWIIFLIVVSIICLIFVTSGCVWVHNKTVQVWEVTVGAIDDAQDAVGELGEEALGEEALGSLDDGEGEGEDGEEE